MSEMNFQNVAGFREEMEELIKAHNLLKRVYFDVVILGRLDNGDFEMQEDLGEEIYKYFENKSTSPLI